MTKEEFEEGYARRSDTTVESLNSHGLWAYPCECDENGCPGWQMTTKESVEIRRQLGLKP